MHMSICAFGRRAASSTPHSSFLLSQAIGSPDAVVSAVGAIGFDRQGLLLDIDGPHVDTRVERTRHCESLTLFTSTITLFTSTK